ncbi:MAG TPA: ATP-binding protein [Chloroflexota bacterium]|nr:ATP-binding protein [Chloroflexota bacterium]
MGNSTGTAAGGMKFSPTLSLAGLRWLMGMFIACVGALMLLVPHRFSGIAFALLRPQLNEVASAFFVLGSALAIATAFSASRLLLNALHVLVGLAWLLLAAGFLHAGNWSGSVRFVVFGLGTLTAPLLVHMLARREHGVRDAFAVVLGVSTVVSGIAFVITGGQTATTEILSTRTVGLIFCVAGAYLVAVQLFGRPRPVLNWSARLMVAGAFLVFLLFSSLQAQSWLGFMYYAGFGGALLLAPIVGALVPSDPESLWAQLGIAVMLAAAVPLVAVVAIICSRQQDMVTAQTLRNSQRLAVVLADDVAGFTSAQRALAATIASTPGLAELPASQLSALLARYESQHPEVFGVAVYDPGGQLRAGDDDLPAQDRQTSLLEAARGSLTPVFETATGKSSGVPTFVFAAPIWDANADFSGLVAISVPADRWLALLRRASGGDQAYIVDTAGHVLVQPDGTFGADVSGRGSVRALMQPGSTSGALIYQTRQGLVFAGFARVPELGGVIVESPASVALAAVYAGRELSLKQVIAIVVLAGALGLVGSRMLSAPLGELAQAAGRLAGGDHSSPLPRSRISELRRLATIFGDMRESLRRQTEERERAEQANRELLVRELQARAQSETLQQLNRFKDELLENVAHELRTPLTSIRAYSELLLTYTTDPETQREFTSVINEESERLTRLLNDVLDLTKIQSGKLQWHVGSTDLAGVLREAARKHAVLIRGKGLNFEVEMPADLPLIQADSDRLMQVVDNLLSNATKFTKAGEITLRASHTPEEITVAVVDTGVGIPGHEQALVFEKFHQVTQGLTDKPAGTGLGLAICKEIVEYHHGRIWVESEPGRGSTFAFTLPLAAAASSVSAAALADLQA